VGAAQTVVGGSIGSSTDVDYFRFTLAQRAGVFIDLDAETIGSTLDSVVGVFAASSGALVAENDQGWDFTDFPVLDASATPIPNDSALYLDLAPGTYDVRVRNYASTTGAYQLKLRADTAYASAVPAFSSLPGAADTLYLDFDGHAATDAWGTYSLPAYDFSGNAGEWTPGERAAIENVWRTVAEDYAPFNVNVTTAPAATYADGVAFRQVVANSDGTQVGHGGSLGVAYRNSYASFGATYKTAFTFANNFRPDAFSGDDASSSRVMSVPLEVANTSSHEFGHALGLPPLRQRRGARQRAAQRADGDARLRPQPRAVEGRPKQVRRVARRVAGRRGRHRQRDEHVRLPPRRLRQRDRLRRRDDDHEAAARAWRRASSARSPTSTTSASPRREQRPCR
jgi:hypothetical protein